MSDSQVTTLDDAPAVVTKPAKAAKATASPSDSKLFNVTVHATGDEAGNTAVEMCINGFLYQLPRGVPCAVPATVVEGLKNAVVTHYKGNGSSFVEQNVPRYAYSVEPA